jgi:hypothetical protein
MSLSEIAQIAGALAVLVPFVASQLGALRTDPPAYLWPNVLGSAVLAALAYADAQWGFLLLELTWALVATRGLLQPSTGSDPVEGG